MKLLPTPRLTTTKKVNTSEPLGLGFDAAVVLMLFFGLGALIDWLVGTTPVFMIVMTLLGAVGVFTRFYYRYDANMAEHEARRQRAAAAQGAARRSSIDDDRDDRDDRGRRLMSDPNAKPNASHTVPAPDLFSMRLDGPAPEVEVSRDMIKRGLLVGPLLVGICAVIWGSAGAWSSAYGLAIVLVNFALAAAIIAGAARISLGLMMAATMFGYLIRLGLIFLAVWIVRDASWISFPALGSTIIVTHLGLLFWEMKYVALSLSQPGLKTTAP